jgi:hypothetical protein
VRLNPNNFIGFEPFVLHLSINQRQMKKTFFLFLTTFFMLSCASNKTVEIAISNSSSLNRENEMVEVSISDVFNKLQLADTAQIVVLDNSGQQVPYQITYNEKLIFPVIVKANGEATYSVKHGTPVIFDTKTCGKFFPERLDDVAWENDRIAFRTYGPALQATGEQAYGFDIWAKRVSKPVVEERYAMELNDSTKAEIARLNKTNKAAAKVLRDNTSYHLDHGNGLDYYNVGPTLGAGTSAFFVNNSLWFPKCFVKQDILDNGPLRFTVKLDYAPLNVNGDTTIIESRVITLDAGSQLNKAVITFLNTKQVLPLATGIVIHKPSIDYTMSAEKGYITYADPKDSVNGQLFIGAVFPGNLKETKVAKGHVLAISDYEPGAEFTYYFGAGWTKWGFNDSASWVKYISDYAQKVRTPLTVKMK